MAVSSISGERPLRLIAAGVLLAAYGLMFFRFFPNINGHLGHDYARFLPQLLDGFIWNRANGLFSIPWFTPSFCGGWVHYPNPECVYYSLPGMLAWFLDPLTTVRMTWLIFAISGFAGFYVLLCRVFRVTSWCALFGAGLFLFNGYYTSRMMTGHLGHTAFMLIPWISFFLLRPKTDDNLTHILRRECVHCVICGLMFAYMVHSAYGPVIIPGILCVATIGLLHIVLEGNPVPFMVRLFLSGVFGIAFSISKLTPMAALMANFSRSDYALPGAATPWLSAWLMFRSLFTSPAVDDTRMELLTNTQWYLGRHEWEYSVTALPLLLLLYGLWRWGKTAARSGGSGSFHIQRPSVLAALIVVLMLPIALNTYQPAWNALLKQLPLLKSASSLVRWCLLYIPIVLIGASLIMDRAPFYTRWPRRTAVCGMLLIVLINLQTDRSYYHRQNYDPAPVQIAFQGIQAGIGEPRIHSIGVFRNETGGIYLPIGRNDLIVRKASALFCYEALLGYQLEALPIGSLHPGPALEVTDGVLNLKNPSCYVWPAQNNCLPGDHFSVNQFGAAERFLEYKPFPFQTSVTQRVADRVNLFVLIMAGVFLLAYAVSKTVLGRRAENS